MFDLNSNGNVFLIKSLLNKLGVDKTKIENFLDSGTRLFDGIGTGIKNINDKLDLLVSRTEPRDNETAIAYIDDGNGGLKTVTGSPAEVLQHTS